MNLSQYLTNLMHKIYFTVSFISCLYMFRAHVLIIRWSKLHYTASGIITPIGGYTEMHGKQNVKKITPCVFSSRDFYFLPCCLFNDAISNSAYTATSGTTNYE